MKIQISLSTVEYRYAMVNRPIGIGCCPKDIVRSEPRPPRGSVHYDLARNGVAVYSRRLTDHETKQFEMAYMVEGIDLQHLVELVAKDLMEYAAEYVELEHSDEREYVQTVYDSLKRCSAGYPPSVDAKHFSELVLQELKKE